MFASRALPRTVLVLRFSAAGDVILTAPALAALGAAWPQARVVLVTHEALAPLLASHPALHAVVGLRPGEPLWGLRRRLDAFSPDAVLDLHGKARGLCIRLMWPRARRARWHKRSLAQTLAVRVGGARYRASCRVVARYHAAVEALVGRRLPPQPLHHVVTPAARAAARTLLAAAGARDDAPIIGMSPGAAWATKRWPVERFAALARWARDQGHTVVVTGSPGERAQNRVLAAQAPGVVDLTGALSLAQLPAVVAQCRAFVANDSGPMHLARALCVPTLAIFGSTDPGQFDFTGHALLWASTDCAPCSFHGLARCPRGHLACLNDIAVTAAQQELARLLQAGPPPQVMG